jgi:hypothetical protein
MNQAIRLRVDLTISPKQIEDLLCCAFEGGSNYWYTQLELRKETSNLKTSSDRFYDNLLKHGFRLKDRETNKTHLVSPDQFETAMFKMLNKHNRHFNNVVKDNVDAETGDVFLQLVVHGEVIYG